MNLKSVDSDRIYILQSEVHRNDRNCIECHLADSKEFGQCFVKICNYRAAETSQRAKELLQISQSEAEMLGKAALCTDKVPRLFDSFNDRKNGRYVIVMQKLPGMTLRNWLNTYRLTEINDRSLYLRASIIRQLSLILSAISAKIPSAVHRDLKPENIFIAFQNGKWTVYLTDFGCAHLTHIRGVGTDNYQSPEQVLRTAAARITTKADVFALGLIFYELLTGTVPKQGVDFVQERGTSQWRIRPELPDSITAHPKGAEFDRLIKEMTEFDPKKRADYIKINRQLNYKPRSLQCKKP